MITKSFRQYKLREVMNMLLYQILAHTIHGKINFKYQFNKII